MNDDSSVNGNFDSVDDVRKSTSTPVDKCLDDEGFNRSQPVVEISIQPRSMVDTARGLLENGQQDCFLPDRNLSLNSVFRKDNEDQSDDIDRIVSDNRCDNIDDKNRENPTTNGVESTTIRRLIAPDFLSQNDFNTDSIADVESRKQAETSESAKTVDATTLRDVEESAVKCDDDPINLSRVDENVSFLSADTEADLSSFSAAERFVQEMLLDESNSSASPSRRYSRSNSVSLTYFVSPAFCLNRRSGGVSSLYDFSLLQNHCSLCSCSFVNIIERIPVFS